MGVYVDTARHPLGRMIMSHMIADTEDELHLMAEWIGMRREWFQGEASFPHYDVSLSRRAVAIRLGATVLSRREMALKMREIRARED